MKWCIKSQLVMWCYFSLFKSIVSQMKCRYSAGAAGLACSPGVVEERRGLTNDGAPGKCYWFSLFESSFCLCACPTQTPRLSLPAPKMSGRQNQLTEGGINVLSEVSEWWLSLKSSLYFMLPGPTYCASTDTAPPCRTPFSSWPWLSVARRRASCRGWRTNIQYLL